MSKRAAEVERGAASGELSRTLASAALGRGPAERAIVASAAERAALARRFDIPGIEELSADVKIAAEPGAIVRVDGRVRGKARRECVVSGEEFEEPVDELFTTFLTEAPSNEASPGADLPLDDREAPEPIVDGVIDYGEIVAQHFALALDPFPRSPNADSVTEASAMPQSTDRDRPLAGIRDLLDRKR